MKKRLFLFAAYDKDGIMGKSEVWYIDALLKVGDVVFVADSTMSETELKKLPEGVLYAAATRHEEYDFGSYKRAYKWAKESGVIDDYEFLYLVNDSVYGPITMSDFQKALEKMENLNTDAFSMACKVHTSSPHMQSWFIGLKREVFLSDWFDTFISSVEKLDDKVEVCIRYETGFSCLLREKGVKYDALFHLRGREIYGVVRRLVRKGMPFVKKSSFLRHNGCLGQKVRRILFASDPGFISSVIPDAQRTFGEGYVGWFLLCNSSDSVKRYLKYLWRKVMHLKISVSSSDSRNIKSASNLSILFLTCLLKSFVL